MAHQGAHPYYDYSTLEVAQQQGHGIAQSPPHVDPNFRQSYQAEHGDKFTAPGWNQHQEQNGVDYYSHDKQNANPGVLPEPVPHHAAPEVAHQQYGYAPPSQAQPQERRTCGMRRKTFFIVLAIVLLLVIGAIVGGVVGGVVSSRNKSSDGGSSNSTGQASPADLGTNSPVLDSSQISAINWTDSKGGAYHAVFWQAKSTSLMASLWNSKDNKWSVTNITAALPASSVPLQAKKGTPLAAAVRSSPWTEAPYNYDFGISLFFLTDKSMVAEVASKDIKGTTWQLGDLTKSGARLQAGSQSSLAVWWSLCSHNCSFNATIYYEDQSQGLLMNNQSNWLDTPDRVINPINLGSGIAATGMVGNYGADHNGAANSFRLYYDASNVLQELMLTPPDPTWFFGSTLATALPNDPPRIAVTAFSDARDLSAGPLDILFTSVFTNGSILMSWWNNDSWSGDNPPTMQGKVYGNFSSVSLYAADEIRFFGLTSALEIHSYTVDRKFPMSWTYAEQVKTS